MDSECQVLVYAPARNRAPAMARFEGEIENLGVAYDTCICSTIGTLSQRLRRFEGRPGVMVLFAADRSDLAELIAIRSLFRDIRIILLLPDRAPETVSKGHSLMPRFLAYCDGNFKDVAAVLDKMLKH